jgi:hypothetical protein
MRKNNIHVHKEEFEQIVTNYIDRKYSEQGINLNDEQLIKFTNEFLKDKKESDKMYENIMDHKIFEALRQLIKIEEKNLPMDDFINIFKSDKQVTK